MAKLSTKRRYNQSDVSGWIKQAEDDWSWAKASFREEEYKGACFVAHQLAEKSLKALIFALTPKFAPTDLKKLHTHDLFSLTKQVEAGLGKCPAVVRRACEVLNDYYMSSRYPDVHEAVGEYTAELAEKALKLALAVFKFAKKELALAKISK